MVPTSPLCFFLRCKGSLMLCCYKFVWLQLCSTQCSRELDPDAQDELPFIGERGSRDLRVACDWLRDLGRGFNWGIANWVTQ